MYDGVFGGLEDMLMWDERLYMWMGCLGIIVCMVWYVWLKICPHPPRKEVFIKALLNLRFQKSLGATTTPLWPGELLTTYYVGNRGGLLPSNWRHYTCYRWQRQASLLWGYRLGKINLRPRHSNCPFLQIKQNEITVYFNYEWFKFEEK